ncbi:FtsW/RodA/SpoVE family cell cycle protein [Actinomycetospora straminea]|uniref:Cell division protein FtsI/penicillin-binding protein 2 n=1 Tax=Actinomycetospora straminea TaxID=663607 RepID=A0ABP9EKG4_9PSEU|nr:FtsW/RodA/SpoVE family cell cycle protein [Actinomycetospora straminea]MDD7936466.1 FtsW/RodA/SpoVE family cell cycle protein [Actinomycetospora straminea]
MLSDETTAGWDEPAPRRAAPGDGWGRDRRRSRWRRALGRLTRRSGRPSRAELEEQRRARARAREERGAEPSRAAWGDVLALLAAGVLVVLGAANLAAMGDVEATTTKLATGGLGLALLILLAARRRSVTPALAWTVYGTTLALLLAVLVVGREVNGARRWLAVGGITLQPSELAKIAVPLALAAVLTRGRPTWRRFAVALPLAAVPIVLVADQPDLSTATLLTLTAAAVLVIARVPTRYLLPVLAAAVVAAPLAIGLLRDYQVARLGTFLTGSQSAEGPGWAVRQARLAIARGGWWGDRTDPVHLLAARYLPERETDLALASLASGWGAVAAALALLAGLVIVWRCVLGARAPRSATGRLLCAGFAVLLAVELVVSTGGNLGLLPVAGVPFPVLSGGGTATVVHLAALGLAISCRRDGARRPLWTPAARSRPRLARTTVAALTVVLVAFASFGAGVVRDPVAAAASVDQMTRCVTIPAPRGAVVDRHGTLLAADAGDRGLRLAPALLRHDPAAVERLAGLLGRPPAELHALIAGAPDTVVGLDAGTVSGPVGDTVAGAGLPGVVVVPAPRRSYPTGPVLAPVLGWVGRATPTQTAWHPDLDPRGTTGRAGVEQSYDAVLRGVPGEQCYWVDPVGRPVAAGERRDPVPGTTLTLTIDLGVQRRLVADVATSLAGSPRGAVGGAVAMDPRTGAVLALASWPSLDNALYGPPLDEAALRAASRAPGTPTLNHAIASALPPGSTYKLVNAAANMVHPVFPPDRVIPTGGSFTYGTHTFGNWRVLPPQDMVDAIAWSNDVYFYKLALGLGPDNMIDTARALGVGQPTGIDLPGESPGYLGTPASVTAAGGTWYPGSTVILGIGQGPILATPLQTARWTAAVATGAMVTPHVGMAVGTGPGAVALPHPAPTPLPFADRLGPVRDGMRAVVTSGTGRALGNAGITVAAKSGTAEDPSVPGGGVDDWMTAVAPADAPDIVVTALAQRPDVGSSRTAGVVASTLRAHGAAAP